LSTQITNNKQKWQWWQTRRLRYNKGLIIAGILAFLLYCIVGEIFIAPHEEFEVTLFTIGFQGIGYLIMMLIANAFYSLGYVVDRFFNSANADVFRKNLYNLGYWFSICLPFSIPVILIFKFAF
jgi:ABC-type cobalamin transport system permease subunit